MFCHFKTILVIAKIDRKLFDFCFLYLSMLLLDRISFQSSLEDFVFSIRSAFFLELSHFFINTPYSLLHEIAFEAISSTIHPLFNAILFLRLLFFHFFFQF